jgi:hypothetical protein
MAEFIVRLDKTADSLSSRYYYEFRSADGVGPLEQEYVADLSTPLVRQLCGKIDEIIRDALSSAPLTADPVAELTRLGRSLYNTLFPSLDGDIPDLARKLGAVTGPLLLRTNESDIPWELLHTGTEFLGFAQEVGRRKLSTGRVLGGRGIGRLGRALIVGDPNDNLESARAEAGELTEWLRRHDVECTLLLGRDATLLRVFQELESGEYDLLHYCGHVAAPHGTKLIGLRLHGDELMDSRALQPLARTGAPPVVFINGCESASRISDLCSSFAALGTKLAVGTLYAVEEQAARKFSQRFYADLMSGASAGAAVRAARGAVRSHGVSWTAFLLYGDPSTQVTNGEPPAPVAPPSPPAETKHRFDGAAQDLLERVMQHAAPHGVVTSMDLLAELLNTPEIERRLKQDHDDESRLALAGELLRTVLDIGPATPVPPDTEIEFSDTVATALTQAEQLADDAGRVEITVSDIIAAFVAVGGGSSAQLLELFGISLAELAGADPRPVIEAPPPADPQTNGQRPASDAPLFDGAGRLRSERLAPSMVAAIRVAALLASAQNTVISTGMLLYGLGVANNELFAQRLRAQGEPGIAALDKLSLSSETRAKRFSPRTLRALERAVEQHNSGGPIADAAILAALLAEDTSTARQLLIKLGVDPDGLLNT